MKGQTRYFVRLDDTNRIKPDVSGRRLRFQLGKKTDFEVANAPDKKSGFYRGLIVRRAVDNLQN